MSLTDDLKGFPAVIDAVYPQALAQTCRVHLIRYSLAHASYQQRKRLAAALKVICRAPALEQAEAALDAFEAGPWGRKYAAVARSWRSRWIQIILFFAFSESLRRAIYSADAMESLNSTVRTLGHFPNDRAAAELIYLALRKFERKWERPPAFWHPARTEFALHLGARFRLVTPWELSRMGIIGAVAVDGQIKMQQPPARKFRQSHGPCRKEHSHEAINHRHGAGRACCGLPD